MKSDHSRPNPRLGDAVRPPPRWLLILLLPAVTGLTVGWNLWQSEDCEAESIVAEHAEWMSGFEPTVWPVASAETSRLWRDQLSPLPDMVEGSGLVVHRGQVVFRWGNDHHSHYVASAMKPMLNALLLLAVERGLIDDVHSPVAEVVPELKRLNGGVDAAITWHHLATMTSAYGVDEAPGEVFAYNDYAVQLFYDALIHGVFDKAGDDILHSALADPLGWEDRTTFLGFGEDGPEPKMRASARDLAKFGQWLLNGAAGAHGGAGPQLSERSRQKLIAPVVGEALPFTQAQPSDMLPGQETFGGGAPNLMSIGPGRYGYHLWHNRSVGDSGPMLPDAPTDSMLAVGKLGQTVLWMVPSWELVVAWTNSSVTDKETAAHDPDALFNQVSRLLAGAVERAAPASE